MRAGALEHLAELGLVGEALQVAGAARAGCRAAPGTAGGGRSRWSGMVAATTSRWSGSPPYFAATPAISAAAKDAIRSSTIAVATGSRMRSASVSQHVREDEVRRARLLRLAAPGTRAGGGSARRRSPS